MLIRLTLAVQIDQAHQHLRDGVSNEPVCRELPGPRSGCSLSGRGKTYCGPDSQMFQTVGDDAEREFCGELCRTVMNSWASVATGAHVTH